LDRLARSQSPFTQHQLTLGVLLIAFGAIVGGVFGVILAHKGGVGLAIGTAVIGAGAALTSIRFWADPRSFGSTMRMSDYVAVAWNK
jgi:hypothetical protein